MLSVAIISGALGFLLYGIGLKVAYRYPGHWHYRTLFGLSILCFAIGAAIGLYVVENL